MKVVRLADCPETPWRNGGGRTRELLAWPTAGDWLLRVSVASIEADGPFSPFPGVDRCFAVLVGAGVVLALPDGERHVTAGDTALSFPGEAAPMCRLIDGPTHDLNLMVRRGAGTATMQRQAPAAGRWRGLYADASLWWTDDPAEHLPAIPDQSGVWHLAA